MGSIFDFPDGVDLSTAIPAEALFRASGLSRRASLVLSGLGFTSLAEIRISPWMSADAPGLYARLQRAAHCGAGIIDEIDRWRAISADH